jgi:hypothetical protein
MVAQTETPQYQYSSAQISGRITAVSVYVREYNGVTSPGYEPFVLGSPHEQPGQPWKFQAELASGPAKSREQFTLKLRDIAATASSLLRHLTDPDRLENEALLFWPTLSQLHAFLGSDRLADEIISALDEMRAQFLLRPVTAEAVTALHQFLANISASPDFTDAVVDDALDLLEASGVEPRYPLTFSRPDDD